MCWSSGELHRQAGRSAEAEQWFPRHGSHTTRIKKALGEILEGFGQFQPREVGAEAVVHSSAEGQDGWWIVAGDVESQRFVVDGRIAIRRVGVHEYERAC